MCNMARRETRSSDKACERAEVVSGNRADKEQTRYAGLIGYVKQWHCPRALHLLAHHWIDECEAVNIGPVARSRKKMIDDSCCAVCERQLQFIAMRARFGDLRTGRNRNTSFDTISQPFRARWLCGASVNLRAQLLGIHVVEGCEMDDPGKSSRANIGRGIEDPPNQ